MKLGFLLSCAMLYCVASFSQDPVKFQFSSKKTADGKLEIHLKASVEGPWHTYSQTTPEGGPLPTKIKFQKNPLIALQGIVKEIGEMKLVHDPVFDVDVKYFPGDVDFVQVIDLKKNVKTKITGTIEFMACNDKQCLPPKTIPFSISLP